MTISEMIEQMNKEFMAAKKYDMMSGSTKPTIADINNGFQVEYSHVLAEKLLEMGFSSIVYDLTVVDIPHLCVKFNGLYYDCEAPHGVQHPQQLPIFATSGATLDDPITWDYRNDYGDPKPQESTSFTRIKI